MIRQAREQGLTAQLVGGDSLNTSEYPAIAGPAADGTLFTFAPDPRRRPENREIVERFRAGGYDPEGYTLYTYAAFQVFAEAAEAAKSVKLGDLEKAMRSRRFATVAGDLEFDAKGDLKHPTFDVYAWQGGKAEVVQ
jgi:branched-chain amino acid transport system substrate-binding protein